MSRTATGTFVCLLLALGCSSRGGGGGAIAPSASTAAATTSSTTTAPTTGTRPEYLEFQTEDAMSAPDIVKRLDKTVAAPGSGSPASGLPLRDGLRLTAEPKGKNVILRIDADAGGVRQSEPYVEVAVSQALGKTFKELVQASMATAALTSLTPGLGAPWNLWLHAESTTGGIVHLDVAGDENGNFTVSWKLDSPTRQIDQFAPPVAFGPPGAEGATEKIGGTVHFPIDRDDFKRFVNQAYGYNAPQRFTDFALIPHTWLHLTVTADATGRVVNVHFDAITTKGARLYVAEAPASSDVGGRFYDETLARMQQMLDEEAAKPGSSKKWGSSFYYADATKGVVDVVVKGEKGHFDIAYAVETPVGQVKP